METAQIEYQVNGTVSQRVEILKAGIAPDDLIRGLHSGAFIVGFGSSEILETTNWTVIAKITCTDVMDDMEYSGFELEEK